MRSVAFLAVAACGAGAGARGSRVPTPAEPNEPSLPAGVVASCFLPARCEATGDLDADGKPDRVVAVAKGDQRGLAIQWGSGAPPTLVGAGTRLRVVEYGDTDATTPRSAGATTDLDADLSYLATWDILTASVDANGHRALARFTFLPAVHGDALKLDGGDSAWVLYRTATPEWFWAPLGF